MSSNRGVGPWLRCLIGADGPPPTRDSELHDLALRVERAARALSGLSAQPAAQFTSDTTGVLGSVALLLERMLERGGAPPPSLSGATEPEIGPPGSPGGAPGLTPASVPPPSAPPPPPPGEASPHAAETSDPPPVLSALIGVRDRVLAADPTKGDPAELTRWFSRLVGQVLEDEGVSSIDERGPLDPRRQKVVATTPTADASNDEVVADTVRPGYAYRGRLLRPQEVIVYAHDV